MEKSRKYLTSLITILVLGIVFSFNTIIGFISDYKWFSELGFEKVFLTKLMTQLKIGIPIFLIIILLAYLYLMGIKKDYYKKIGSVHQGIPEKRINQIALLGSIFVAFISSSSVAGNLWFDILRYLNSTSFNLTDPIFNKDVSFYMFQYPFWGKVYLALISFIVLLAILTLGFYMVMLTLRRPVMIQVNNDSEGNFTNLGDFTNLNKVNLQQHGKKLLQIAVKQIIILGVTFFVVLGVGYYLRNYDLLYSPVGVVFGAGYTDIKVNLLRYRALMILSLISAIILVVGVLKGKRSIMLTGPAIMIVVSIIGSIAAVLVQNYIVSPDEISKERQYIENGIAFTQRAYGIDDVVETDFPANQSLTREDIENNHETISNIRINDYRPTRSVYNQKQGIRYYYNFNDVDIDRYYIDGEYRQVFISPRELDQGRIEQNVLTFINKHLKYTHGYGIVMSPVNEVTTEGLPYMLIENIPPKSDAEDFNVDRPEVYFGELTNDFIIVNTEEKEFDYPQGSSNVESIYDGTGGIRLNGMNKLLYAYTQKSLKMLLSGNITSESKIVLNRNIHDRVRKIMPYLEYDSDPYIVLSEGKLYWIIDAFTTSGNYPYSQPLADSGVNYIRNSVKVVIDAYNGDVTYYVTDNNDPLINTYRKIFPQLFTDFDQMPEDIKSHIRYPQTLFDIQAEMYRTFHMEDPVVFYNSEDEWHIARELYDTEEQYIESNYFVMKLPEEDEEEFVLTIPFTPKDKKNMTALLVGRNDNENYGELVVYKLPKSKNTYGPMQIENKIDSDDVISKEFSLWSQRGSRVIRGNVLTIPIEDSLIYVEPIYLQATSENSLPEVQRVVVGYGERIVMEPTLEEALERLFGTAEKPTKPDVSEPTDIIENEDMVALIIRANDIFDRSQEAQRSGDWAEYGRLINELENVLQRLNALNNLENDGINNDDMQNIDNEDLDNTDGIIEE